MRVFPTSQHRRWSAFLLLFSVVVIVCEIAFLGNLDMVKKASMLQSWTSSLTFLPSSSLRSAHHLFLDDESGPCIELLEREDNVSYARNFDKDPVQVVGVDQDWTTCTVGCKFGFLANKIPDATFGLSTNPATATVHRSMESSKYYMENNIGVARRW